MKFLQKYKHNCFRCNLLIFYCIFAIFHSLVLSITAQNTSDIPISVSDMTVSNDALDKVIYVTDSGTGGIYFNRISNNKSVGFDEFHLLFKSLEFQHPSAITTQKGNLIICDQNESAVFEINPKISNPAPINIIRFESLLKLPNKLAVSEKGEIAIGGDQSDTVILYNPESEEFKVIDFNFNKPRRLIYWGSNLIVMNQQGEIYQVDNSTLTVSKLLSPDNLLSSSESANDICAYLNIFYFASNNSVASFAQNKQFTEYNKQFAGRDKPLPVVYENGVEYSPTHIFVNNEFLFVVNDKTKSILQVARPIPVDIEFSGDSQETTTSLIVLYNYLYNKKIIPIRSFENPFEQSLEDILKREEVIVSASSKLLPEAKASLGKLICSLNVEFCNSNNLTPENILNKKILKSVKIQIPNIHIVKYETSAIINLKDKTVKQYLKNFYTLKESFDFYVNTRLYKDNPISVTDSSNQEILYKKGLFRLPVFRWRTNILLNEDALFKDSSSSLLNQLSLNKTYLFSKQSIKITQASRIPTSIIFQSLGDEGPSDVQKNRLDLKDEISFPKSDSDLSGVIVAIGEKDIDFNHPDFIRNNNESIWFELQADGSNLSRYTLSQNSTTPTRSIGENFLEADHGTHVAGLIASRSESLTPGLIPSLDGLVQIDTSTASDIRRQIQNAIHQGIFIYNFSFTFPNENAMGNLKESFQNADWQDRLFIVAAGNTDSIAMQNLEVSADPPIKWVEKSNNNMIGVSAVVPIISQDGTSFAWLDPFTNTAGQSQGGAKFGKRFVQIVAPGKDIYSLAKNNSYKKSSGTSQAVPQVTAAAAILWSEGITKPALIKARLMYTTDWFAPFQDKVYGGLLNVDRSVWQPLLDIVRTTSIPEIKKNIIFDNNPDITVIDGKIDSPENSLIDVPFNMAIKFSNIYRITRQSGHDNLFRVFYYDEGTRKLRILNNASLSGKIKCKGTKDWDPSQGKFKNIIPLKEIDVSDIFDYVADIRKVRPSIGF